MHQDEVPTWDGDTSTEEQSENQRETELHIPSIRSIPSPRSLFLHSPRSTEDEIADHGTMAAMIGLLSPIMCSGKRKPLQQTASGHVMPSTLLYHPHNRISHGETKIEMAGGR